MCTKEKPTKTPDILILQENKKLITKVQYRGMILSCSEPNNAVLTLDKSVAEIEQIYKIEDSIRLKIKRYLTKDSIFSYPCDSSELNMWQVDFLPQK